MSKLKRIAVLAVLAVAGGVALAAAPHFVNANATIDNDGNLVVSWKEAGLGDNQLIDYQATAFATAECTCVTNSGRCPKAANKVTTSGEVSAFGSFSSGKNGNITASLTVEPPPCPPSDPPTCGSGQHLVLSAVTYTDISLTDLTNGIPASGLPTSLSKTFFVCP